MGSGLACAESAEREIRNLPAELALAVHRELLRLAEDPVRLDRRVRAPIRGMFFGFKVLHEGVVWTVSATFVFSQDEKQVVITGLGWMRPG